MPVFQDQGNAPWIDFVPTLTQSATVTKTVTYAKYQRVGRLIVAMVDLAVTGTGTGTNAMLIGLPVTAAVGTGLIVGAGKLIDISAGFHYKATVQLASTTTVFLMGAVSTNGNPLGVADFTAALAAGDFISYSVTYEAEA